MTSWMTSHATKIITTQNIDFIINSNSQVVSHNSQLWASTVQCFTSVQTLVALSLITDWSEHLKISIFSVFRPSEVKERWLNHKETFHNIYLICWNNSTFISHRQSENTVVLNIIYRKFTLFIFSRIRRRFFWILFCASFYS